MHTLYAQLVHLFKVPTDGESARKWSSEDLAGVVLSLCSPILAQRGDGSGVLVRRLPVLVDVLDAPQTYDWAHRPVLETFLEATGLNAHRPLSPGGLRLHQFLCLVNPSLSNASPETFCFILDVFKWPTEEIFHLLLHILVHPLPNLCETENWSDSRLATTLLAHLGPVVFRQAPLSKELAALNAPQTPPMPDWAKIPRTALAFHVTRLRDTHFDSFLAWSAMQSLQLVPAMLKRWRQPLRDVQTWASIAPKGDEEAVPREKLLNSLVATFDWLIRSGRDADDINELRFHRAAHCVRNEPHSNCPYHSGSMVGGQELHQWCHCSGARLVGHIDPLWTLAHAEDAGSCLEEALCAVIEALGNTMPARMTVQVPKHKINQVPALRPMMQKITASPLLHMGRYAPALVETVLNSNRDYFLEAPEGVAALAEFFAHLLRWTIPRSSLLRNQHGGAAVPGKTIARFAAIRTGLVHTLLEAPWGLLPRNWDSPIAAQWYTSKHGTDPNLSNAPTSLWDVDLTDGMTATEVEREDTECEWWLDEGAIALLKVAGTYIDLDELTAEKLEVRVKDEHGTESVKQYVCLDDEGSDKKPFTGVQGLLDLPETEVTRLLAEAQEAPLPPPVEDTSPPPAEETPVAPRPPPVSQEAAVVAAKCVRETILGTPPEKRTRSIKLACSLPICVSATVDEWVKHLARKQRKLYTIKTALVAALNPNCSVSWACAQTHSRTLHTYVICGLVLNLRMHAFTREAVEEACAQLPDYTPSVLINRAMNLDLGALPSLDDAAPAAAAPAAAAPAAAAPAAAAPAAEAQHHDPLLEMLKEHSHFTSEQCAKQAAAAKAIEASLVAPPPPPPPPPTTTAEPDPKRQKQGDLQTDPICLD